MVNIFYDISPEDIEALSKNLEANTIDLKKSSTLSKIIFKNILGVVLSGHAQIIRDDYDGNRSIVEELSQNMVFSSTFSSLSSEECSLIAKEDSKLLLIDYDRILNQSNNNLSGFNQLLKNLLEITTEEVNKKNIRIEILTKKTIRAKLLTYFNIYAKNKIVYLSSSYTNLADYLAIDRSAMTRELKNLKDEGFIETKGKTIKLNM